MSRAGSLKLDRGSITMSAKPGTDVRLNDSVVASATMVSDADGDPTTLVIGTLRFYVIKRKDQFGVRVKDKENPARLNFKGLEYFPIDPAWRFEATFRPYLPPRVIKIATMINTVSPTYSREILTPAGGGGLDGLLRFRHFDVHGILNGLDLDVFRDWKAQSGGATRAVR